jgi:hypothetical protein
MRLHFALALALTLAPRVHAADDGDDPKMTRAATAREVTSEASPPPTLVLPDEDDPKMARGAATLTARPWWQIARDVPRLTLSYRYLDLAALTGGTQHFDGVGLAVYPLSWYVRAGLEAEFAWGGGPYQMWLTSLGGIVGVQYPARVTPFLDGRFLVGLVGGTVDGASAATWMYAGGVETGVDVYYARRFYLTAAIGWMHPVYHGIDVSTIKSGSPVVRDLSNDTLTFKVGLGL